MAKKTIDEIIEIEPKIKKVFDKVLAKRKEDRSNWVLYKSCKRKLERYVGFFAKKQELANPADYETVIETLAIALYL